MNLLGVYLGAEENLMVASKQNERGFWENMAIYRLNEELLELLGGSWYRPPELTPGWAEDERVEKLRERALAIVRELAVPGKRWGFKDPRTIVLLPFWRRVIGEMDYLICVRRADAFVRSVQALEPPPGNDPQTSARLWLDMNAAALRQTTGARRMLVFYEDWCDDPRRVVTRLATFIHGNASAVNPQTLDAAVAFFDPGLRRAEVRQESANVVDAPELEAMYAHMRLLATHDGDDSDALVAQALADGYRSRQRLCDRIQRAEERVAASRAETESVRAYAGELEQTQDELRAELAPQGSRSRRSRGR